MITLQPIALYDPTTHRGGGGQISSPSITGLLNVMTYGATGDGVTDDTSAINATISAAAAGDVILIPPGTYVVGSSIVIDKAIAFIGTGWSSVIKAKSGAALGEVISITADNTTIENLKIDGNRSGGGTTPAGGSLISTSSSHLRVSRCEITGAQQFGVSLGGAQTDVEISGCYIHDNGSATTGGGTGIKASLAGGNRLTGLRVISNVIARNYALSGSPNGSALGIDASHVIIDGNDIFDNFNGGGQIAENGANGIERHWTISNNHIYLTSTDLDSTSGVEYTGTQIQVTGNSIWGLANGTGVAIEPEGAVITSDWAVSGNSFLGNKWGVSVVGTGVGLVIRNLAITGNTFSSNTTCIALNATTTKVSIVGNVFGDGNTTILSRGSSVNVSVIGNVGLADDPQSLDASSITTGQVAPARGGTGVDASSSTGMPVFNSGVGSISTRAVIDGSGNIKFHPFSSNFIVDNLTSSDTAVELAQNGVPKWWLYNWPADIFKILNAAGSPTLEITQAGGATLHGSLAIGAGTAIQEHLAASGTWNPGAVSGGAVSSIDVTVTGAAAGDTVDFGFSPVLAAPSSWQWWAGVTGPDTVTVYFKNTSGGSITPASTTVRVGVWKH